MSTTGQEIINLVRQQLLEPVAGFWTDAELLTALNNAQSDFLGTVRSLDAISTFDTVAGRQVYELPAGLVSIRKVFINIPGTDGRDNWAELKPYSLEKLSQEYPNWLSDSEADQDDPARYMIYEDSLYLHPVPADDALEVRVFHKAGPSAMTLLSDYIAIDDSLKSALVSHILWNAWQKDKEPERAETERRNYLFYVGQGRRFYIRQMGGLTRTIDVDSSTGLI